MFSNSYLLSALFKCFSRNSQHYVTISLIRSVKLMVLFWIVQNKASHENSLRVLDLGILWSTQWNHCVPSIGPKRSDSTSHVHSCWRCLGACSCCKLSFLHIPTRHISYKWLICFSSKQRSLSPFKYPRIDNRPTMVSIRTPGSIIL